MPRILPFFFLLLSVMSCEKAKQNEDIQRLAGELDQTVQNTQKLLKGLTNRGKEVPELATDEVEKLFQFEYRVIEFEQSETTEKIEATLQQLGRKRWECFHIEADDEVIRVFCKRRPKTYLRYLLRMT